VRLLIEFFLASNTKAGETPADDPALKVPVLMLLDEFLSLGRVEKLVHALAYVRGWGIRIATVIQSEAQVQAVYGRELAEQISKIVGQKTVNQTSYSYGEGRRSRQVSQTGQAILDTDEIAHLREDETIVLVEGVHPMIGQKLRYYRDKTFKARRLTALPLPAPLVGVLPDAPRVTVKPKGTEGEAGGRDHRAGRGRRPALCDRRECPHGHRRNPGPPGTPQPGGHAAHGRGPGPDHPLRRSRGPGRVRAGRLSPLSIRSEP
jgi:hypothetical protein